MKLNQIDINPSKEITKETLQQLEIKAVASTGQNKDQYGLSGFANPFKITKPWGHELIYQNHNLYCCKLLYIKPFSSCSYHLHLEKHETLLVTKGTLFIDTTHNKNKKTYIVEQGSAFVIAPGFIHSLRAESEAVELIESSTPSYDTDSIRISNGENHK